MSFYPSGTGNYSAKTKKRAKYGVVAGAIIVLLVMSFMFSRPVMLNPPKEIDAGKINVVLTAQVFRDGVLIEERVNDDDLLLNTFLNVTMGLFAWPNDSPYTIDLYSAWEGEVLTATVWNTTASATIWDTSLMTEEGRAMCDFGEGTTPPARDDDGPEDNFIQSIVWDVTDFDTDDFTITFMYVSDGSYDWSEVALCKYIYASEWWGGGSARAYFARDTFTPIAVVLGDTLVANYRFEFSSGYTTNAMKIFYGWLIGGQTDTDTTVTLTDNGGNSRTVRLYTDDGTDTEFYGRIASPNNGGWIAITDSSSGIPSRSAYRVLGSSIWINSLSLAVYNPNYDVTVSATLIPSSAITVTCSGVFMYSAYVGGTGYFLMWALSHSGVYVAENTPVQATFTLEM